MPVPQAKTVASVVSGSVSARRVNLGLVSLFAGMALLLACLGVYGLLAYSVAQRTGEIGIRLALGLTCSLALTRFLQSLLFEVAPLDAASFFAVPAVLAIAALAACLVPAFRAARIQPMIALRYE